MALRRWLWFAWLCAMVAHAVPAYAESAPARDSRDAAEQARSAFQRGVGLASRGDYAAAVEAFETAAQLRPAPAISYNLASALYELGRTREAHAVLARLDLASAPADVRERATLLEGSLRAELALLTVRVSDATDVTLHVDGEPTPLVGGAAHLTLLPGIHHVAALRPYRTPFTRELSLEAGERASLELALADAADSVTSTSAAPVAPAIVSSAVERDPATDPRAASKRWLRIGIGAVVLAGVAVVVPLVIRARERDHGEPAPATSGFSPGVLSW